MSKKKKAQANITLTHTRETISPRSNLWDAAAQRSNRTKSVLFPSGFRVG